MRRPSSSKTTRCSDATALSKGVTGGLTNRNTKLVHTLSQFGGKAIRDLSNTHIITQYSHCPHDPGAPPARLAIAACPAAVAANLERFLSASGVEIIMSPGRNIRWLINPTGFFLLFDFLYNAFYLRKVQILRSSVMRGDEEHTFRALTVTFP